MARRFGPGFIATAEQGANLHFRSKSGKKRWEVSYQPSPEAINIAEKLNRSFETPKKPVLLLEGDRGAVRVTFHPHNLDATSPNFMLPRYDGIETISLENFGLFSEIEDISGVEDYLANLPTGFVKDPYHGLGINFDIRLIIETIQQANVKTIRIVKGGRGDPVTEEDSYVLPFALFDKVRLDIGRVHNKALAIARVEKTSRLHDKLLTPLDATKFPSIGQPYQPDAVIKAVGDGLARGLELSAGDASLIVNATASLVGEVAKTKPIQLLKLTKAIETVTLESMIAHLRSRISSNHGEENWQKFLTTNAFILRLAFGVPVLLFQGQATVGGRGYNGSGDKRSDFLMRAAKSGNLSIVEIKTPQTDLLAKKEYRGGIYPPHQELVGAVAQVLDQRWQLQQNNTALADAHRRRSGDGDDGPAPETYAVQCIVLAGTAPQQPNHQKSLELYRNGLNGVLVLTFDELLLKLEILLTLLRNPDVDQLAAPTVTISRPKRKKKRGPTGGVGLKAAHR
jgi:Domain of unknown function (DUF4263)